MHSAHLQITIHKRRTRSILKSFQFHWESVTRYLTGRNSVSFLLFNIIFLPPLLRIQNQSRDVRSRSVPWSARRNFASVSSEEVTPLSSAPPCVFTKDEQRTSRLASLKYGSSPFTETVTFFADRGRTNIRERARATSTRRDGSSRTDNAGRRWRPRPSADGNGRGPAASRESVSRATIDGRG